MRRLLAEPTCAIVIQKGKTMFKCKRCGKKFKKVQSLGAHTRSAHWLLLLLEKGYTPSQLKKQGYDSAAVNEAAKRFRR